MTSILFTVKQKLFKIFLLDNSITKYNIISKDALQILRNKLIIVQKFYS